MSKTTFLGYVPSLKEKHEATIVEGKAIESKGGSIRYTLRGEYKGRKTLPKTVSKADFEGIYGFDAKGAESAIIIGKDKKGHSDVIGYTTDVKDKTGFTPEKIVKWDEKELKDLQNYSNHNADTVGSPSPASVEPPAPSETPFPQEPSNENFSAEMEEWNYVNFEVTPQGLKLTSNGRWAYDDVENAADLLEDVRANSNWEWLTADQLGALSEADVLAQGSYSDDGDFEPAENVVYAYTNYQIRDWFEELQTNGVVVFKSFPVEKGAFYQVDEESDEYLESLVKCRDCGEVIGTEAELREEVVEWYNIDGQVVCAECKTETKEAFGFGKDEEEEESEPKTQEFTVVLQEGDKLELTDIEDVPEVGEPKEEDSPEESENEEKEAESNVRVFVVSSVDYETDGQDLDLLQDFTFALDKDDIGDTTDMQEIADEIIDDISDVMGFLVNGFYFQEKMPDGTLVDLNAENYEAVSAKVTRPVKEEEEDEEKEEEGMSTLMKVGLGVGALAVGAAILGAEGEYSCPHCSIDLEVDGLDMSEKFTCPDCDGLIYESRNSGGHYPGDFMAEDEGESDYWEGENAHWRAEGHGNAMGYVHRDFRWETDPHPHEHDDLIDEMAVMDEMEREFTDQLEKGEDHVVTTSTTVERDVADGTEYIDVDVVGEFGSETVGSPSPSGPLSTPEPAEATGSEPSNENFEAGNMMVKLQEVKGEAPYYNCPYCRNELTVMSGKGRIVAICENESKCNGLEVPRQYLENYEKYHWYVNERSYAESFEATTGYGYDDPPERMTDEEGWLEMYDDYLEDEDSPMTLEEYKKWVIEAREEDYQMQVKYEQRLKDEGRDMDGNPIKEAESKNLKMALGITALGIGLAAILGKDKLSKLFDRFGL